MNASGNIVQTAKGNPAFAPASLPPPSPSKTMWLRSRRGRTHLAWNDWIRYFLTGVIETASQAAAQATELLQIREEFRKSMHAKPKALALIDHLLTNPYMTVRRATRLLQVSQPTARAAVMALQAAGILIERTGRAWGGVYVASRILDAIDIKPARSTPQKLTPL